MCLFFLFFFFFKQKTAYDMRISDWSSDVCSSDLYRMSYAIIGFGKIGQALAKAFARSGIEVSIATTRAPESFAADAAAIGATIIPTTLEEAIKDRKSVVQGKSVSVRVDLGGRRIIKKKSHQT